MKIRAITLDNVRRFTEATGVEGVADGLNVLCEPNEHGKSTLFDAIQALFFKPHGSRDREVASLRPHAGGAPEVRVEVETEEGRF
ncbi:AAA family ATPase, partial [Cribrihabitans sp. XS_ASV171]